MKHFKHSLVLLTLIWTGSVTVARADLAVSFSNGHQHQGPRYHMRYHSNHPHYRHHNRYHPYEHHHRHYARPRYGYPYRQVVVTPVVVPQPYYVQPAPAPVTGLSGDYGQDLAGFRERLSRLRAIVDRQKQNGTIDTSACDRFTQTLDAIEKDQRIRAYNRGGNLSDGDFADLFRRLDQTDEDIELVLAQ